MRKKHAWVMHKYVLETSQLLLAVLYNGYIAVSRIISLKSASLSLHTTATALLLKMAKLICIVGLLLHPLLTRPSTGRIGLLFKGRPAESNKRL